MNRAHRWNWGLIVEQTPYTIGQFSQGVTVDPNFGTAFVQQETRITQINRGITGITQYPLQPCAAGGVLGGIRRISFDYEVEASSSGSPAVCSSDGRRKTSSGRMHSTSVKQARRSSTTRLWRDQPDPWTALSFEYRKPPAH